MSRPPLVSTNEPGVTRPCTLLFVNSRYDYVQLLWVDYAGEEKLYVTLGVDELHAQPTFTTHPWRVRHASDGRLLLQYVGPDALLELLDDGGAAVGPLPPAHAPKPEWGAWRKRGEVPGAGLAVRCFDCVEDRVVRLAEYVAGRMLEGLEEGSRERLRGVGAELAIIGRSQVTTDMPPHAALKNRRGGRDLDGTTRGLGGTPSCPVTSFGEENVTREGDKRYPQESILVHELAHTVMTCAMTEAQRDRVRSLYRAARTHAEEHPGPDAYNPAAYDMVNEDEYWAEGTQAWFDATVRRDATSGITTREELLRRDPELAALMKEVFGANPWRYRSDPAACPGSME